MEPSVRSSGTHATLFDTKVVDEKMGDLYRELESSFESRREYMTPENVRACEARLSVLRGSWILLLDKAS